MTLSNRQRLTIIVASLLVIFTSILGLMFSQPKHNNHKPVQQACNIELIGQTAFIKGGTFLMGSNEYYKEEGPQHTASVADFDIDIHEVTNAQFADFIDATQYITSAERATEIGFAHNGSAVFKLGQWQFIEGANWRHPEGPDSTINGKDHYPVVHISKEDAEAYAIWAGRALPTEAQWEYAVRGGLDETQYAWGNSFTPDGQYMANTWQGMFPIMDTADDAYKGLAPVNCFAASPYGLYDMIGNVWEWTSSPYFPEHRNLLDAQLPQNASNIGFDPRQKGIPVGVIKGGSFLCANNFCKRYRPTARHSQDIKLGTNHIGFRTVSKSDSTNQP